MKQKKIKIKKWRKVKMSSRENRNALIERGQKTLDTVIKGLSENNIKLDSEQLKVGRALLGNITTLLQDSNVSPNDVDGNSFRQALEKAMLLKLNASANPRQCYVILRNTALEKVGHKTTKWGKKIEFGVEGSGNDTLLAEFGIGVKEVGSVWKVREGDEFEYPTYRGFEATPPKWTPKGTGKLLRVVYPIKKDSGAIEYHIAEREDVIYNLMAHISQNMMPHLKDSYNGKKATLTEEKRKELLDKVKQAGLDATLDGAIPEVMEYILGTWTEHHSRENMIERKMRNNAIKKYPKNFREPIIEKAYQESTDEDFNQALHNKDESANKGDVFDIDDDDFELNENENENENESADDNKNEKVDQETGELLMDDEMEVIALLHEAYTIEVDKGKYAGKTLGDIKKIDKGWIPRTKKTAEDKNLTSTDLYRALKHIVENDDDFKN